MDKLLAEALQLNCETENIDFKQSFDANSKEEWPDLIKDIIAMANSGGGILIIGLDDDGTPSGHVVTPLLNYDPADITNKIYSFTDYQFSGFRIFQAEKDGFQLAVIEIRAVSLPIVFTSSVSRVMSNGKQKIIFQKGTVYFRHGAKSEPGNSQDLRNFLERELESVRDSWLSGIRKVVEAPPGVISS